jgi:DNA-binding NarL/FixJ family response regulator
VAVRSGATLGRDGDVGAIEVAIVEDDRLLREGLAVLIDGTPGFRCRATFGSVEAVLQAAPPPAPDVVLLDLGLPGMQGAAGVAVLRERMPSAAFLILTVFEDPAQIVESLCNGAVGYLLKRTPPARLLDAIREAHEGGAPMSPEIARRVVAMFRELAPPARTTPPPALAPAERRLLALLVQGLSYQECATQLQVSVNTVRSYIRAIYDKLQVHSKAAAVARALRERLV